MSDLIETRIIHEDGTVWVILRPIIYVGPLAMSVGKPIPARVIRDIGNPEWIANLRVIMDKEPPNVQ